MGFARYPVAYGGAPLRGGGQSPLPDPSGLVAAENTIQEFVIAFRKQESIGRYTPRFKDRWTPAFAGVTILILQ